VTYPLILGVSLFSAAVLLPSCPFWVVGLWFLCTGTLLVSLTLTACTNPGIVRRHKEAPPQNSVRPLIWSGLASALFLSKESLKRTQIDSFERFALKVVRCSSHEMSSPNRVHGVVFEKMKSNGFFNGC
jgi:hypothetical protein